MVIADSVTAPGESAMAKTVKAGLIGGLAGGSAEPNPFHAGSVIGNLS